MEIKVTKFDKAPKQISYPTRVNKVQVWEYKDANDKVGFLTFEASGIDAFEEAYAYMSVVMTALFPKSDTESRTKAGLVRDPWPNVLALPPLPHQTRQWELKSLQEVVWQ